MALFSYPLDLTDQSRNLEYPHFVTFTPIVRGAGSNSTDHVALYLPADALKTSYSQTYGDADLGAIGVAIEASPSEAAENMQIQLENLGKSVGGANVKSSLAAIAGLATGTGSVAKSMNLSGAIAQATVNEAIRGASGKAGTVVTALQKKAGRIQNPHKAVIYSGPGGFRTFSFNYVMQPQNKDEAKSIASIVHFFKYHMHPGTPTHQVTEVIGSDDMGNVSTATRDAGGDINTSMSLTYPEEFKITMNVNRRVAKGTQGTSKSPQVGQLFKIKNCFLESCAVDYSTSGAPAFIVDGEVAPVTTTLSLSFKETVLMTKNSIKQGF